ncbi:MAG: ABC transporter ATP-binding protein [Deltaproteobacteria bacterium]|nr:ABC transporter ATP-binding protein [Deltaproteobacteria bacterium]
MNADRTPLLVVEGLTKSYYHLGREVPVLKGVDVTLAPGEMLAVVGKSGVGKSTFLHVAGTLDRPTAGHVLYDGTDVFERPDDELARFRNRHLGFVFQFHHLLPEFNALENVMMPALLGRLGLSEAERRAGLLLEQVGLSHRLTHRPGELSGGEQQRVAIARALVMQPRILFADEPTGNLDERTSEDVHELLFRLNRELSIALVIVTHNFTLAGRMGRCLMMRDGRMESVPAEQT